MLKIKKPSLNQWIQSFKAFNLWEKILFLIFLISFISSLIFLLNSFYNKNTEIKPAFGGNFKEGLIGQPKHINPVYSSVSDLDKEITNLIFSGLMKYGKDGKIENDLIENYSFSNNGKTFNFKIKDALWHDKTPLTMDDIIFTFNIIRDPEYLSPLRASFQGITLEKLSETEGCFKLMESYSGFLENLTNLKIIPKHLLENITPQSFASDKEINILSPIGSGPYKMYRVKENGSIHSISLIANENYYVHRPYIKEIVFNFYSGEQELSNALLKNKIDNAHLNSNIEHHNVSYTTPNYFGVFLNTQNKILENPEIREALSLAINREEIINDLLLNKGYALASPILPSFYNLEKKEIPYDTEKSIKILENNDFLLNENGTRIQNIEKVNNENINTNLKSGNKGRQVQKLQECLSKFPEIYPSKKVTSYFGQETKKAVIKFQEKYADEILTPNNLSKGTGVVSLSTRTKLNELCFPSEKNETVLEINLKTINYSILPKVAENIKKQWEKIGIKVNIETYDNTEIKQIIRERNYDAILFGEKLTSIPNPLPYWHSSQIFDPGLNLSFWQNEKADALLEKIRTCPDFNDTLVADLKSFENIFSEENPAILLYSPSYMYYFSPKIKGIEKGKLITPLQKFTNIEDWYIKTKKIWK